MVRMRHTLRLARATVLTLAMVSVITFGSGEAAPGEVTYQPFCTVEGTVNQAVDRVRWKGSLWLRVQLDVETVTEQDRDVPAGATEGECRITPGETAQVYLSNTAVQDGEPVRGTAHYEETQRVQGIFVRNVTVQR